MNIIQIISDYVLSDSSEGAIMINGDWGIGKSYYWRNIIVPELEKHENPSTGKKYKCLYVSLNGISKPEDIFNQIVISKLPWTKSKAAKIASSLGAIMFNAAGKIPFVNQKAGEHSTDTFKSFKIDDFLNFKNNIICFDDLERIGNECSNEDILGFINTNFIETNQVKVIFIANESEIDKKSYGRIKEKTISRTLNFPKTLTPIEEIFKRYLTAPKYYQFLTQHREYITEIIDEYEQRNLRTIIFAFDIIKKVFEIDTELSEKLELSKSIIFLSLIVAQDFKKGMLTSDDFGNFKLLDKLSDRQYRSVIISKAMAKQTFKNGNSNELNDEANESFEYNFYERYKLGKRKEYFFFKSIYNYILSGYLDTSLLKEELQTYTPLKEIKEEVQPYSEALKTLLNVYWIDSDDIVDASTRIVLDAAQNGDFKFYEYGLLYSVFSQLVDKELIDNNLDLIKPILIEGLKKSVVKSDFDLATTRFIDLHRKRGDDKEIDDIIDENVKRLETEKNKAEIDKFFLQLQGNYNDIEDKYRYSNIFENQTADEIYTRIKGFKANGFRNFTAILSGICKIQNIKDNYSKNKEEIPKLIEKLNFLKLEKESKIDKFIITNLINQLNLLQDRLK